MGLMCLNGNGVEQNIENAMKWFRLSAAQNDCGSQFQIGMHYHRGNEKVKDKVKAYAWCKLAVENGIFFNEDIRKEVFGDMNESELLKANKLIAELKTQISNGKLE